MVNGVGFVITEGEFSFGTRDEAAGSQRFFVAKVLLQ